MRACYLFILAIVVAAIMSDATTFAQDGIRVSPRFSVVSAVVPTAPLLLETSRPVNSSEGQLAVFIGDTDVSSLCQTTPAGITYTPRFTPLPIGETTVVVYFVSRANRWTELGRFPLFVKEPGLNNTSQPNTSTDGVSNGGRSVVDFNPSVSLNVKAQSVALFFPEASRPTRINFTDVAVQASLRGNYSSGLFGVQNSFDLAGSSAQNEALRFGELGTDAMQFDLASYLMQFQLGRVALKVGHISFGTNRHLINSFSSRGLTVTVPINKRFDISAGAANGTSIVGFNNFVGLTQGKHHVLNGTVGVELLTKRPRALRLEVSGLKGSLLPRSNFNQANITDAERSRGVAFRVLGSDSTQRLRFDGGFARSRFTNPADPLLYQGRNVIPVRPVSRNARYLDVDYEILRGFKLSESRPLNLSVAYRHERVDPLYRSVTAFASADRFHNQIDLSGNVGDISFGFTDTRSNDNLAGVASILKTLSRRNAVLVALSSATLLGVNGSAATWLPRLSYNFDRSHQRAAFVPINGDFNSPANVPDLVSLNQSFAAEWQLSAKMRFGYRFNHSFQDSRQPTRERSDLLSQTNGVSLGFSPAKTIDFDFDVNAERASDFEREAINTTLRLGTNVTWRMTKTMVWAVNASTTGAGDRANTNDRRDIDFSSQYSWRFLSSEKRRWQKVQGQFFIRYANRYASATDRLFGFNNLTKFQVFNAGLNLVFF